MMSTYLGRGGDDNDIRGCVKASNNRLKHRKHHSDSNSTIQTATDREPTPAKVVEYTIKLANATRPVLLYRTLNKYLKGYFAHEESKFQLMMLVYLYMLFSAYSLLVHLVHAAH